MSPAVRQLAVIYRTRRIGRHAGAVRDLVVPYIELLKRAGCSRGPTRSEAEVEFRAMERRGLVKLECARRDASVILRVRLPSASESAFFEHVGEAGP